jgi:hypothetical protein
MNKTALLEKGLCPFCQKEEVGWLAEDPEPELESWGVFKVAMQCLACGRMWDAFYHLQEIKEFSE